MPINLQAIIAGNDLLDVPLELPGVYNFYAQGTREVDGTEQDISGSSYLATFGVQMKLTRKTYLGFSYNLHSVTINESTEGTTNTDVRCNMY